MWAAQEIYDGKSHYDTWVPADFIIEGKDQIRGWFNSLLNSAMVSSGRKNYNACYMHGWVLMEKAKMSKSKGTVINPEDLIEGTVPELQRNKSFSKITCSCDDVSASILYFFSETMEKNMKNGKLEISERQT